MGFCSQEEYTEFLRSCPDFERMLIRSPWLSARMMNQTYLTVHHDERPEQEREDAEESFGLSLGASQREEALLQGVQWAGADIAKNHSQCAQGKGRETGPVADRSRASGRETLGPGIDWFCRHPLHPGVAETFWVGVRSHNRKWKQIQSTLFGKPNGACPPSDAGTLLANL